MSETHSARDRSAIIRILDANSNRALEGLRVFEEYLRFVLEDRYLTGICKQLRHDLAATLAQIPAAERYAARETQSDVGASLTAADEYVRPSARDVALAGEKRVEQALRCLEEYAKPLFPHVAESVEHLRYQAYTLARAVYITAASRERLESAKVYVLIDGRGDQLEFARLAKSLIAAEVDILQLRDKSLSDHELLARARQLRELTRSTRTLCIVNDRPDIGVLAHADGVHIGQSELSVKDVRLLIGPNKLVGVSTHSIQQARQAVLDGANYIGCGPTFRSDTKQFEEFPGLELLRQVAAEITLPSFAIGGITLDNLPSILATGMRRIAVSSAVTQSDDPAQVVRQLREKLR